MKKPLLFLASILLWHVGSFLLWLLGNVYVDYAHPDGLSYGKQLLREFIFGIPDFLLLISAFYLFSGVILLSPYRKLTGVLLVLEGLWYGAKPFYVADIGSSMYVHLLLNAWMIIVGVIGFFGKSYNETNPRKPPSTTFESEIDYQTSSNEVLPTIDEPKAEARPSPSLEARRAGLRNLMALRREAEGLPPLPRDEKH